MDYQSKSILIVMVIIGLMLTAAIIINFKGGIAGAVVKTCLCRENADCDDGNPCTEDLCINKEECSSAFCVNKPIC